MGRHLVEHRFGVLTGARMWVFPGWSPVPAWLMTVLLLVGGIGRSDTEEDEDDGKVHLLEQLQPEQYQRADHRCRYRAARSGAALRVPSQHGCQNSRMSRLV